MAPGHQVCLQVVLEDQVVVVEIMVLVDQPAQMEILVVPVRQMVVTFRLLHRCSVASHSFSASFVSL